MKNEKIKIKKARGKARGFFLFSLFTFLFSLVLFFSCQPEENSDPTPNTEEPDDPSLVVLDFTAAKEQAGSAFVVPADFVGMCHAGSSDNHLDKEYPILKEMGVVWVHWDFSWSSIQREREKDKDPAEWNWTTFDNRVERANAEGKKIIGMLLYDVDWVHTAVTPPNPTNITKVWPNEIPYFTKYAVETVKRYNGKNGKGKVDAWLIWNEPDLAPRFWSDPATDPNSMEDFFELTHATASAIRGLDKTEETHTELVGGVFTAMVSDAWINGLFGYEKDNVKVKDLLDGAAIHPYSPNAEGSAGVFASFREKVKPYGFEDNVWLNEMGYPTYTEKGPIPKGRYGTDQWEGDMPRVVAQTFALTAAGGARNLTWYHLFDSADRDEGDSEDWFGLIWRKSADEWIKKGGYRSYAVSANNLPGKTYKKMEFAKALPGAIQSYYFEGSGADNGRTLIVWNTSPLDDIDIRVKLGGSKHKLWDVETGKSSDIEKNSTYTLYPDSSGKTNLVFLTWEK